MFIYGKTAASAIAIMGFLAVEPRRRFDSRAIAKARGMSQALTGKLLTQLAAAGLVRGVPGPGGGYSLAKAPKEICLLDIVTLFEPAESTVVCPFGRDWCGTGDPCPLHDKIVEMIAINRNFMGKTRLTLFEGQHPKNRGSEIRLKRKHV